MGSESNRMKATDQPFSRALHIDEALRKPEEPIRVQATPEERAALAVADGLPPIAALEGEFKISPIGKDILRVTGEVRARVTQTCVVTLEPFDTEVVEPVDVRFALPPAPVREHRGARVSESGGARASRRRAAEASVAEAGAAKARATKAPPPSFPSHEEEDPPEPIVDGRLDLGALAAEFMALGLDPYPRKPGVSFKPVEEDPEPDDSPFADLARLRPKG